MSNFYKKIETVKDLKGCLNEISEESPVFLGTWNGYSDTYTVADHVMSAKYEEIENDFFGTRGKMDKRLFNNDFSNKDVLFIGSLFSHRYDNKEIDFPDNPNEPIEFINGKEGDHDLFWKSNNFHEMEDSKGERIWVKANNNYSITYYPSTHYIDVTNLKYTFKGECIGLEDYFDIMKACKIHETWRIG